VKEKGKEPSNGTSCDKPASSNTGKSEAKTEKDKSGGENLRRKS